jgi:hypothetical protein
MRGEYLYAKGVNREVRVMDRKDLDLGDIAEDRSVEMPDDVVPEDPGPALAGNTPLVGSLRRSHGFPVARDEIAEELDF